MKVAFKKRDIASKIRVINIFMFILIDDDSYDTPKQADNIVTLDENSRTPPY